MCGVLVAVAVVVAYVETHLPGAREKDTSEKMHVQLLLTSGAPNITSCFGHQRKRFSS